MTINEGATEFAGLEVDDYMPGKPLSADVAWRVRVDCYDPKEPWAEVFERFLDEPGAARVRAFVVGNWGEVASGTDVTEVLEALVAARDRLPALEALFLGDIQCEESEISWIQQGDISPIFSAYPKLVELRVRGGSGLSLGSLKHPHLETLIIETGGLDTTVVQQVAAAELPKLKHLELWLGDDNYGATWTPEDLAPILQGERFPALKTLGLCDSCAADGVAKVLASAPILERLEVLDLSLGTLSDDGALALLRNPALKRLKRLDLRHHYLSEEAMAKVQALGIEVDVSEPRLEDGEEDRYVMVGE